MSTAAKEFPTFSQDGREATFARAPTGFVVTGNFDEKPFSCETQNEAEDVCRLWSFHAINPFARKTLTDLQPIG